jgi:DNA-binding MarR family transcriptional regulator
MDRSRNDIIADFTREITKLNIGLKQYLQSKLRQNDIDLTFEMLQVLGCLWRTNGINQQEIANVTVKDKASMTYLIDNLVKRNLVYRQEDVTDRRNKLIFLTKEGKALQAAVQPLVHEMYSTAGQNIKLDIINGVFKELEQMRENLRQAAE